MPAPNSVVPSDALLPIDNEYIEDLIVASQKKAKERHPKQPVVGDDALNLKELKRLQTFISQTTRPSWLTPPPSNLGEAKHGKLKADQWRSCIEFDVPTAMAQIWILDRQEHEDNERTRRQKKLVEATLLLATAIRWATSHRTSTLHAIQTRVAPRPCVAQLVAG